MPALTVFNQISLDGFFTDAQGAMSFAHNPAPDAEWDAFVSENARVGGLLVFGRITYEFMESFWQSPVAAERMPVLAGHMTALPKLVFSRTLDAATWNNTRLVKEDLQGEIRRLKTEPGPDMVILGSGSIVAQLAQHGLIDEYQFVVIPVVLGGGRTMFEGLDTRIPLTLRSSRTFSNGNTLLTYRAAQ
jgi:dihydrofolate reductase